MPKNRRRSSSAQQEALEAQRTAMQAKIEQELRRSMAAGGEEATASTPGRPPEPEPEGCADAVVPVRQLATGGDGDRRGSPPGGPYLFHIYII